MIEIKSLNAVPAGLYRYTVSANHLGQQTVPITYTLEIIVKDEPCRKLAEHSGTRYNSTANFTYDLLSDKQL